MVNNESTKQSSNRTLYQKSVSVVVLAAGLSTRMGEQNKLLLDIDGAPLIRRTLKTLLSHDFAEMVVVLGHQSDIIRVKISDLRVKTVLNPEYLQGQMTSVHCGLQSLTKNSDGVMIYLSDLALFNVVDLHTLRMGFDKCTTGVLAPTFKGQRGNPIILDSNQISSIVKEDKNLGCKRLVTKHPELVTCLPMANDHVLVDMDTPDAYQHVLSRIKTCSNTADNAQREESI